MTQSGYLPVEEDISHAEPMLIAEIPRKFEIRRERNRDRFRKSNCLRNLARKTTRAGESELIKTWPR